MNFNSMNNLKLKQNLTIIMDFIHRKEFRRVSRMLAAFPG